MAEEFTVTPEFEYVENLTYKTKQTEFELGYVQTRAFWPQPKRRFTLTWNALLTTEKEKISSFFRYQVGAAGVFLYQPADPVDTPDYPGTPSTATQTLGSYGSRTYYYATAWVTAYGETRGSEVRSFALQANQLFVITLPKFPTNVTKARVYIATTTAVVLQAEVVVSGASWTEPDKSGSSNGLNSGASPPTTNTAYEKVNVHLLGDEVIFRKVSPVSYSSQFIFEEIL